MSDQIMRPIFPLVSIGAVAALAITVWFLERELAFVWIGVSLLLPVAWGALEVFRRKPSDEVRRAIFFGGLLLAFPLLFTIGDSLGFYDADDKSIASNAFGILMGSVLIFMGNYLPKRLPPLDPTEYDLGKVQMLHRFAGWAFVIAGIGYMAAWLVLPATPANVVASGFVLLATALVVGRRALTRFK